MDYTIKRNTLSKTLRIIVHPDGRTVVVAPRLYPLYLVKQFVESKKDWIQDRLASFTQIDLERVAQGLPKRLTTEERDQEYLKSKEHAREILEKRVVELNTLYGFSYTTIAIRNQKTRWGSCSKKGNLNFNYKVAFLPQPMMDYVIIHELCHLAEFNHSSKFWDLVERTVPDHRRIRHEMKQMIV